MSRWLILFVWFTTPVLAQGPQTLSPLTEPVAAPEFTLTDLERKTHRLSSYRGKVVMVNFWATWCPPCRKELPSMERLWQTLKNEDFILLAVNVGEEDDLILPFIFSTGTELTFPILLDKPGEIIKAWPVKGLPTTFVIDRRGRIVYRAVGGREMDDPQIVETLRTLLR